MRESSDCGLNHLLLWKLANLQASIRHPLNMVLDFVSCIKNICFFCHFLKEAEDLHWKVSRTRMWMNWVNKGSVLPPPYNLIPNPKAIVHFIKKVRDTCRGYSQVSRSSSRLVILLLLLFCGLGWLLPFFGQLWETLQALPPDQTSLVATCLTGFNLEGVGKAVL